MPFFRFIFLLSVIIMRFTQAEAQALFHGSRHEKKIALTFDACPSSTHGGFDARIVQTLIDSGVPATFFLSGKWIMKHRNEVKKLALIAGFELGNHSYSHPHCINISEDSIRQELQRTEFLLNRIAGASPKLFRPPYGETDQRVEYIANNIGLTTVMYDLASGDPDTTISRERLIRYVVTSARNGSIIVMHVNGRGWHTSEALPYIIQALRAKGFIFLKVSELLKARNGFGKSSIDRKNP
ncbi:MAG: polysaccharide deacetylase family protein [Bacteroidota bacterium]